MCEVNWYDKNTKVNGIIVVNLTIIKKKMLLILNIPPNIKINIFSHSKKY